MSNFDKNQVISWQNTLFPAGNFLVPNFLFPVFLPGNVPLYSEVIERQIWINILGTSKLHIKLAHRYVPISYFCNFISFPKKGMKVLTSLNLLTENQKRCYQIKECYLQRNSWPPWKIFPACLWYLCYKNKTNNYRLTCCHSLQA